MTLIFASIPEDSPPVLAADCLLSGGASGMPDLPSGRNEEAGYLDIHSELCRKLYILTPHVAVLVAGSYIEVKNFLQNLSNRFAENRNQTANEIISNFNTIWGEDTYRNVSLIALIYDLESNSFTPWLKGQVETRNLPRIGRTWCSGSGAEPFITLFQRNFSSPEEIQGNAPPDFLSQMRILTTSQEMVAGETLNRSSELNLNNFYGGFVECCYFNSTQKRFLLINRVLNLYWYIPNTAEPPYNCFFGFHPRAEEDSDNFHFYRTKYNSNNYIIEKYENIRKTKKGHLLNKTNYIVHNIVPSINDYCHITDGNYVFNTFYVLSNDLPHIPNRKHYLSYYNDRKWLTFFPKNASRYEVKITEFAKEQARIHLNALMNERQEIIENH